MSADDSPAAAVRSILARTPVVPVLVVGEVRHAAPLARALVAGGLAVLEVTLRTPAALDVIAAMRAAAPGAMIGAGTLTRPEEFAAARVAGAAFGVTPGFTAALAAAASDARLPLLPGVMTPAEILAACAAGYDTLKFFPAEQAGGSAMLRALAGPFAEVKFCPTGGTTRARAPEYLELDNVVCVGGSWVAPQALIDREDWNGIERLAHDASALPRAAL